MNSKVFSPSTSVTSTVKTALQSTKSTVSVCSLYTTEPAGPSIR